MKFMWPPSAAIFVMTCFTGPELGTAPLAPLLSWVRYWDMTSILALETTQGQKYIEFYCNSAFCLCLKKVLLWCLCNLFNLSSVSNEEYSSFYKNTTVTIMPILASKALLRENKKKSGHKVLPPTGNWTQVSYESLIPQFRISPHRHNVILGIENWVQKGLFP